jgi:hypothetical protein
MPIGNKRSDQSGAEVEDVPATVGSYQDAHVSGPAAAFFCDYHSPLYASSIIDNTVESSVAYAVACDTLAKRFEARDQTRRVPSEDTAVGYITRHHRARTDDHVRTNSDTRQDDAIYADENIVADRYCCEVLVPPAIFVKNEARTPIVGDDLHASSNRNIIAYPDEERLTSKFANIYAAAMSDNDTFTSC